MASKTSKQTTEEMSLRLNAIKKCVSWIEETFYKNKPIYDRDLISFQATSPRSISIERQNEDPDKKNENVKDEKKQIFSSSCTSTTNDDLTMIGIFAKQDINIVANRTKILLTLPQPATLSCSDLALGKEQVPAVQSLLRDSMERYEAFIDDIFERSEAAEHDFYRVTNGRVISKDEVRLTLFLSLLLCFMEAGKTDMNIGSMDMDVKKSTTTTTVGIKVELETLTEKWSPYLNTWPHDFSSLPPFWSEKELENIKGTSFSKYIARLQNELTENWENIIRPSLVEAGIYNYVDDDDASEKERNVKGLPLFYQLAVGGVQSRTHGSQEEEEAVDVVASLLSKRRSMSVVLHPLLDLVNGERGEEHINVEVHCNFARTRTFLSAIRDIKAGEELIVSYDDAISMSYLQRFGFLPMRRGLPDPNNVWMPLSVPPSFIPDANDELRWKKLEEQDFTKERVSSQIYGKGPFALLNDSSAMRKYRRNPPRTPHSCPPQLDQLYTYAAILLFNSKALRDVPQEPYLQSYEQGKKMVEIIDNWLSQLKTTSNEDDFVLVESQSGPLRLGTYMRMLEREVLVKWRHAICIRWDIYDYEFEYVETNVNHVPPLLTSKSCYMCKSTFHVKKCARCRIVHYCGTQCQKEHWRQGHKEVCGKV